MNRINRGAVLVTGTSLVPDDARQLIERRGFDVREIRDDWVGEAELHEFLAGARGYIIGGYEEPTAAHFEAASSLEVVAWVGTDFRAYVPGWKKAFELGIAMVSTPGANAPSVAEFTILLILTLARPFVANVLSNGNVKDGGPPDARAPSPPVGMELGGRMLGIVGAGRIGAHVAKIAVQGLGMDVLYTGPRRNQPLETVLGLQHVELDDLLRRSDVISLHRPGPDAEDQPLIGRAELEVVRPGTLIVNAAHPNLIDPVALAWAIQHRGIRAAFDGIGNSSSWSLLKSQGPDRFLSVPQMGFLTQQANERAAGRAVQALCDVLSDEDSPLVNNPDFRAVRTKRMLNGR